MILPPNELTSRLEDEMQPRTVAHELKIVTLVPQAAILPEVKNLFVKLLRVMLPPVPEPFEKNLAMPLITRFPPDCVIVLPEISDRFVPTVGLFREIGAVLIIAPVVMFPIVRRPAVILSSSDCSRPIVSASPTPPRTTPPPLVRICTWPAMVALTDPAKGTRSSVTALIVTLPAVEIVPFTVRRPDESSIIISPFPPELFIPASDELVAAEI